MESGNKDLVAPGGQNPQEGDLDSYFILIPPKHRGTIISLSHEAFPQYKEKFREFILFLNKMSKNWLERYSTFGRLAEGYGFTRLEEGQELGSLGYAGEWPLAILTENGSYLFINPAPGGMTIGSSLIYSRLPFRAGSLPEIIEAPDDIYLVKDPKVGERVEVRGVMARFKETSPAIAVYYRKPEAKALDQGDLPKQIEQDFQTINAETLGS